MGFTYPPSRCGNNFVCHVCPPFCVRARDGTVLSPPAPRLPVAIPICASRKEIPVTYPKSRPLKLLLEDSFVQVCPPSLECQISDSALPAPGVLGVPSLISGIPTMVDRPGQNYPPTRASAVWT